MSNEPNTLWRRWRKAALTLLGYAVAVVVSVGLFGPEIALTIAKIGFVLILLGSYAHRKVQLAIESDDSGPIPAEHPGASSNSN